MNLNVFDLIDFDNNCWNIQKVREAFLVVEQNVMLDIPLSNLWSKDRRYWRPTSNGIYTVISAYWLVMLGHLQT